MCADNLISNLKKEIIQLCTSWRTWLWEVMKGFSKNYGTHHKIEIFVSLLKPVVPKNPSMIPSMIQAVLKKWPCAASCAEDKGTVEGW